uniref:Alternative protein ZNF644 n=1 Tax=Homo sapiens TaxID=9606 RepID=L0R5F4_HUMAN|nr:alternative protein ZNF644 [Homo sapiens]
MLQLKAALTKNLSISIKQQKKSLMPRQIATICIDTNMKTIG